MFIVLVVLAVIIILNGLLGDFLRRNGGGLTTAGLQMSFAAMAVVAGFFIPVFFVIAATTVGIFLYGEFNSHIYNV